MTEYTLAYLQRMTEAGLPDSIGLDYNSARDATPRWYGVSFGNGNDGVSHLFPAYYVRTADPWRLARIAILSQISDDFRCVNKTCKCTQSARDKATEALEVDGDSDYTIYAMIRNPLDWDEEPQSEYSEDDAEEDWCSINGAWMICEVFPLHPFQVDIYNGYTSMEEAFTADELKLGED